MRCVFADSFYFFALLSGNDRYHSEAIKFAGEFRGQIVTTGFVLMEVADGLSKPPWRSAWPTLLNGLRSESRVHIEPCTEGLFELGSQLYGDRADKSWSLTDCISFVVMQREGIKWR